MFSDSRLTMPTDVLARTSNPCGALISTHQDGSHVDRHDNGGQKEGVIYLPTETAELIFKTFDCISLFWASGSKDELNNFYCNKLKKIVRVTNDEDPNYKSIVSGKTIADELYQFIFGSAVLNKTNSDTHQPISEKLKPRLDSLYSHIAKNELETSNVRELNAIASANECALKIFDRSKLNELIEKIVTKILDMIRRHASSLDVNSKYSVFKTWSERHVSYFEGAMEELQKIESDDGLKSRLASKIILSVIEVLSQSLTVKNLQYGNSDLNNNVMSFAMKALNEIRPDSNCEETIMRLGDFALEKSFSEDVPRVIFHFSITEDNVRKLCKKINEKYNPEGFRQNKEHLRHEGLKCIKISDFNGNFANKEVDELRWTLCNSMLDDMMKVKEHSFGGFGYEIEWILKLAEMGTDVWKEYFIYQRIISIVNEQIGKNKSGDINYAQNARCYNNWLKLAFDKNNTFCCKLAESYLSGAHTHFNSLTELQQAHQLSLVKSYFLKSSGSVTVDEEKVMRGKIASKVCSLLLSVIESCSYVEGSNALSLIELQFRDKDLEEVYEDGKNMHEQMCQKLSAYAENHGAMELARDYLLRMQTASHRDDALIQLGMYPKCSIELATKILWNIDDSSKQMTFRSYIKNRIKEDPGYAPQNDPQYDYYRLEFSLI